MSINHSGGRRRATLRTGLVARTAPIAAILILVLVLAGATAPGAESFAPDRSPVFKTTPQGELRMHLFLPPDHTVTSRRAAVVFFFGGGWRKGRPEQFYPQCAYLASRGMVAASAEYRVQERHGALPPDCVRDGKSAIRWMRVHASELGVDPRRVAAGGGSAGGHVAASAALLRGFDEEGEAEDPAPARPDALLLFNPVLDTGPGSASHERVQEYWKEFSPLHNIRPGAAPTIVFLGADDHVLPVATAERFRDRMKSAGSRCDLRLYAGQRHGFFNYDGGGNAFYYATLIACDRFLGSLGYVEGEPTLRPPGVGSGTAGVRRRGSSRSGPPHRTR
ncbi:MAG TPA: alpha/beta hydrolase [Verrucomicrobiales bacterium]|nr:alpha/beta hydrolase [Verrucomicrobiales bacterium]